MSVITQDKNIVAKLSNISRA